MRRRSIVGLGSMVVMLGTGLGLVVFGGGGGTGAGARSLERAGVEASRPAGNGRTAGTAEPGTAQSTGGESSETGQMPGAGDAGAQGAVPGGSPEVAPDGGAPAPPAVPPAVPLPGALPRGGLPAPGGLPGGVPVLPADRSGPTVNLVGSSVNCAGHTFSFSIADASGFVWANLEWSVAGVRGAVPMSRGGSYWHGVVPRQAGLAQGASAPTTLTVVTADLRGNQTRASFAETFSNGPRPQPAVAPCPA